MIFTLLDLVVGTAASLALTHAIEGDGDGNTGAPLVELAQRADDRAQFVRLASGAALMLVAGYVLFRGAQA